MTHRGAAPDCREQLPAHLLMCRPHLRLVPPAIRVRVNDTFYQRNHGTEARRAYAEAVRVAIDALQGATP